ncbi:hypothetical protein M3223_01710 [Paenibacillus pasadenensis]|uniref:hypothetical protein n=1 Tax=Paenibacillus pasadenensis TaxID=217090 RepID=UPI00203D8F84|nr:hypothetical protein [Paenibacillus pasadenensis]MCM3746064.1 hypothetical protein [Paenibacillus pasadenensis]
MKLGMLWVLFILLVVVAQIFCSSLGDSNGSSLIQGSIGFNIYNATSALRLDAYLLLGDFESPAPFTHSIQPGGSYNFQVHRPVLGSSIAQVYYRVITPPSRLVGEAVIQMEVKSIYGYASPSTIVFASDAITAQNGNTWVTIR